MNSFAAAQQRYSSSAKNFLVPPLPPQKSEIAAKTSKK
jgi:hypothetical protein